MVKIIPACIKSDNGSDIVARAVQYGLKEQRIDVHTLLPIVPGQTATMKDLMVLLVKAARIGERFFPSMNLAM